MHTWALFSCSSLITLTAYNLSQLPQGQPTGPEPEPATGSKSADDAKFSLETLSQEYPEHEAAVALPPLPDQPQMSKAGPLPSSDRVLDDLSQYPVKEVDVLALLNQDDRSFPSPDQVITYRADAVQSSPRAIASPIPAPPPLSETLHAAFATTPSPAAVPQPERSAQTPTFARSSQAVPTAEVVTNSGGTPPIATPTSSSTFEVAGTSGNDPWAAPRTVTEATASDLFARLPEAAITSERNTEASQLNKLMTAQPLVAGATIQTSSPEATSSMEMIIMRRQLVERYCERARADVKAATKLAVCADETSELAQRIPEAVTAGTPIPGSVESPTLNKPEIGVLQLGNNP